ncbi:hypothetical protein [Aeromicrobium sp. Sec7.5]|uniref:hypothetical protein n=1 Tax=Aeromicrobium sp. Sec7.5 TaxID=3121276 RepID=UPI002FE4B823
MKRFAQVTVVSVCVAMLGCCAPNESDPVPQEVTVLVVHATSSDTLSFADATAVAENGETAINDAGGWAGERVQVISCAATSTKDVETCANGAQPAVVVASSEDAAAWSEVAFEDIAIIGPQSPDVPDTSTSRRVPVAHHNEALAESLAASLLDHPACGGGLYTSGGSAAGSSTTVEAIQRATATAGGAYLGNLAVSGIDDKCVIHVSAGADPTLDPEDLLAHPPIVLGLLDAAYTSDRRVALAAAPFEVHVASSYLPLTGLTQDVDVNGFLEAGRAVAPDFVGDAAAVTTYLGLLLVRELVQNGDGPVGDVRDALLNSSDLARGGLGATWDWEQVRLTSPVHVFQKQIS